MKGFLAMSNPKNERVNLLELSLNLFISLPHLLRILEENNDLKEPIFFECVDDKEIHQVTDYTSLRHQVEKIDGKNFIKPLNEKQDVFNFPLHWQRCQYLKTQSVNIVVRKKEKDSLIDTERYIGINQLLVSKEAVQKLKADIRSNGNLYVRSSNNWRSEALRKKNLRVYMAGCLVANIPPILCLYDDLVGERNNIYELSIYNVAYHAWKIAMQFNDFSDEQIMQLFKLWNIEIGCKDMYQLEEKNEKIVNKYKILLEFLKSGINPDSELLKLIINQYNREAKFDKNVETDWKTFIGHLQESVKHPMLTETPNHKKKLPSKRKNGKPNLGFIDRCTELAKKIFDAEFAEGNHKISREEVAEKLYHQLKTEYELDNLPKPKTLVRDYIQWPKVANRFNKRKKVL